MAKKITATMLMAIVLSLSRVFANHNGREIEVPVTGYLCLMLAIGALYFLFLLIRMKRKNFNKL